tara:strand:- start:1026 stop:1130 length:105 start_codon:yes stop_codon:yes gene_type:complete
MVKEDKQKENKKLVRFNSRYDKKKFNNKTRELKS